MRKEASQIQIDYYTKTADSYDLMHLGDSETNEHYFALHFLSAVIRLHNIKSVLDVGAGTGRAITFLRKNHPEVMVMGIEPVKALRDQAYAKGVSQNILIDGEAEDIKFDDGEFDLVCEFGVLHHVANPTKVVGEMLRVGKKAIFISDNNNFGQGNALARTVKQSIDFLKLWKVFNYLKTRGKMYQISDGDGLFYSYSVFNNYKQIKKICRVIHIINTADSGINFYSSASQIALFGLKG